MRPARFSSFASSYGMKKVADADSPYAQNPTWFLYQRVAHVTSAGNRNPMLQNRRYDAAVAP